MIGTDGLGELIPTSPFSIPDSAEGGAFTGRSEEVSRSGR